MSFTTLDYKRVDSPDFRAAVYIIQTTPIARGQIMVTLTVVNPVSNQHATAGC